jgi:Holliday junction resolvasome RuvABC endonuclease subunit
MQILGIRTASSSVRYAVVEWNGQDAVLVNADTENKLDFPADSQETEQKLLWLHGELERILRKYPDVSRVAVKMNEYVREKKTTRPSTHMDGVAMLTAMQADKLVCSLLYANIQQGMGSKKVQVFAEANVGRSSKYWNVQMADAVAAAWTWRNA